MKSEEANRAVRELVHVYGLLAIAMVALENTHLPQAEDVLRVIRARLEEGPRPLVRPVFT